MGDFSNLKRFLETAHVDDVGIHYLNNSYPREVIHIYNSKRECNFAIRTSPSIADERIIGKIYFPSEDEVSMIRVDSNGCADYNNPVEIPVSTRIENSKEFLMLCNKAYGFYSNTISRILTDIVSLPL